ncbi:unnamed protein product [Amoebophrya sp. A120]|nr:unnamed protein product [Amoebophrya sp. A120]|eukprot:GSA120T00006740001.1
MSARIPPAAVGQPVSSGSSATATQNPAQQDRQVSSTTSINDEMHNATNVSSSNSHTPTTVVSQLSTVQQEYDRQKTRLDKFVDKLKKEGYWDDAEGEWLKKALEYTDKADQALQGLLSDPEARAKLLQTRTATIRDTYKKTSDIYKRKVMLQQAAQHRAAQKQSQIPSNNSANAASGTTSTSSNASVAPLNEVHSRIDNLEQKVDNLEQKVDRNKADQDVVNKKQQEFNEVQEVTNTRMFAEVAQCNREIAQFKKDLTAVENSLGKMTHQVQDLMLFMEIGTGAPAQAPEQTGQELQDAEYVKKLEERLHKLENTSTMFLKCQLAKETLRNVHCALTHFIADEREKPVLHEEEQMHVDVAEAVKKELDEEVYPWLYRSEADEFTVEALQDCTKLYLREIKNLYRHNVPTGWHERVAIQIYLSMTLLAKVQAEVKAHDTDTKADADRKMPLRRFEEQLRRSKRAIEISNSVGQKRTGKQKVLKNPFLAGITETRRLKGETESQQAAPVNHELDPDDAMEYLVSIHSQPQQRDVEEQENYTPEATGATAQSEKEFFSNQLPVEHEDASPDKMENTQGTSAGFLDGSRSSNSASSQQSGATPIMTNPPDEHYDSATKKATTKIQLVEENTAGAASEGAGLSTPKRSSFVRGMRAFFERTPSSASSSSCSLSPAKERGCERRSD